MAHTDDFLRTFLAILPPEPVLKQIVKHMDMLKKTELAHLIKWYLPEKLHITLQFLGKITTEQLQALFHQLKPALLSILRFSVMLGHPVIFPDIIHPKVVAIEVIETSALIHLIEEIRKALKICEIKLQGDYPFRGHLSLGEIPFKMRKGITLPSHTSTSSITWQVDKIYLMESLSSQEGSKYIKCFECPLGNAS